MNRRAERAVIFLHMFVGLGALAGGFAAISDPINPAGAPVEMLKNSPFDTFLIPGLFLFVVLGLGNIAAVFISAKIPRLRGYASGAAGDILMLWIVVQCIMIRSVHPLHGIFFAVGLVQSLLAIHLLRRAGQFPFTDRRP